MDIRIGITNTPRELNFESSQTAGEIETIVATALDTGSTYLSLKDDKGKLFLIPTAAVAYVEIGSDSSRRVGFVS